MDKETILNATVEITKSALSDMGNKTAWPDSHSGTLVAEFVEVIYNKLVELTA